MQTLLELYETNFFDEEFTERLEMMARFRNRLVHIYWDVDDEVVYQILQKDIEDLELFLQKFMDKLR
ncbi:hypothetical protein DRP05_03530 [Archaeoglobales archaeon]|nr:MAG: hypothetical protein DRP05_03530 [Archaeoglobales archaeon]